MREARERLLHTPVIIEVVYAGGTISSLATPKGYREGGHVVDLIGRLKEKYPDFGQGMRVGDAEVAYTGLSENLDPEDNLKIIDAKVEQALSKDPDAIVVTHGTDSMEQTARHLQNKYLPQLIEKGIKIILTGANDDIEDPETDAWDNLAFAFESAGTDAPEGVYVAFHRELIHADYVVKEPFNGREMNYASVFDFDYWDEIKAQKVKSQDIIARLREVIKPDPEIEKHVMEYDVNVLRTDHSELISKIGEEDIRAILLVLYHSGTANTEEDKPYLSVAEFVKKLREENGIVFFGVTENDETVDLHSYETSVKLREAGLVPLYNMDRDVALEKLKLVATGPGKEIIDKMLENKAGEIDESLIVRKDIEKLKRVYKSHS